MVLVDPMVDPRGGAFTVGLGPRRAAGRRSPSRLGQLRTTSGGRSSSRRQGLPIAGIPERTALIRDTDGSWRSVGDKPVAVYLDGVEAGLEALPRCG